MSRGRWSVFFGATLVSLGCADPAFAAVVRRTFQVGAVVVASARISSVVQASGGAIEIRAVGHRAARAALLIDGQVKIIAESATIVVMPPGGDVAVTVLY